MMKRIISIVLTAALLLTALTVFAEDAEVQSIKIGITSTTMKPGETQKMIISVTPTNANPVLEYESDNPDVVTAAIGTLIANNEGVANITVRVSGTEIQDSVQVTVSNKTPEEQAAIEAKYIANERQYQLEKDIENNKYSSNIENKTNIGSVNEHDKKTAHIDPTVGEYGENSMATVAFFVLYISSFQLL